MSTDFIPARDADLVIWSDNFHNLVFKFTSLLGVPPAEVTQLLTLRTLFSNTVTLLAQDPGSRARVLAKNKARRELVAYIRRIVNKYIRFNENITDQLRFEMGLNFPRRTPSRIPRPTSPPAFTITLSVIREVTVHVGRENPDGGTGSIRRGRPRGVASCEMQYTLRDPDKPAPTHISEFHECVIFTQTSHTLSFDESDRGKKLWFILRWINTTGEEGPWSEYGEAIIP